ncbi:MAG: cytosol aminopeptidase [Porticoccaceae bacterium]|nr:MAG: cytosol aminopeptidase [Porticoccaceae bacterium]
MEYRALALDVTSHAVDCLVAVVPSGPMPAPLAALDRATEGLVEAARAAGELARFLGWSHNLRPPGIAAKRLFLVSTGDKEALTRDQWRKLAAAIAERVTGRGIESAAVILEGVAVEDSDRTDCAARLAEAVVTGSYRFAECKSKASEDEDNRPSLARLDLVCAPEEVASLQAALDRGQAIGEGINFTRRLGDLPPNICTPAYLAGAAQSLAESSPRLTARVLEEPEMRELGMGALLAVTAGTATPPRLIVLEYRGAAESDPPIALVGKGVTFDSGGICLKPSANLDEMKYDMCGAAGVLGTLLAADRLRLPLNLVGIVPAVENMPSGNATRPGDIVTAMDGTTIEILNTDAEGRLILCDALTYAGRYRPSAVIDVATLTGACVVALGHHRSGLFSNDEALAVELFEAGERSGDKVWRLPLGEEYDEQLKSPFADLANVGGKGAGSVTAACFLGRFAKDYRWAHLDIAGTAWKSGEKKGATGRPVGLLAEFLLNRSR